MAELCRRAGRAVTGIVAGRRPSVAARRLLAGGAANGAAVSACEKGPAFAADLIRLPGDAVLCLCVGRGCVRCRRQCVRTGSAKSAGLTALSSDAAPCRRVGRDHVMCQPTSRPEWFGHVPRAYSRGIPRANSRGSIRRRSGHTRAPWVARGRGGSPAPASQAAGKAVRPSRPCRC